MVSFRLLSVQCAAGQPVSAMTGKEAAIEVVPDVEVCMDFSTDIVVLLAAVAMGQSVANVAMADVGADQEGKPKRS